MIKKGIMAESDQNKKRRSLSKELNIESIISAPLVAASKANIVMVTGQTRFLLEYCFDKKEGAKTYEPVMIQMSMSRSEIDHNKKPDEAGYVKQITMTFSLPLLTLIPINSLVIDKVTVDFDMEITSVTSYKPIGQIGVKSSPLDRQAQLNGRISHDPGQSKDGQNKSQMRSRLKVNINASPLPLPVGVLTIIDLYTKAINPVPSNEKDEKNEEEKQ